MKALGTIVDDGYSCVIQEDEQGRVFFTADADIDADGANGQHGGPVAYKVDDTGTESLSNGGMAIKGGKVICAKSWARDVAILDIDNQPKVFPGGLIASMTWYRQHGKSSSDPEAYVDAETVPYIVVPPLVIHKAAGVVCGCKARATWNGKSVDCVVADQGSKDKVGEMSIAAARALGLPSSPRTGGTSKHEVLYELWPDIAAIGYVLEPA